MVAFLKLVRVRAVDIADAITETLTNLWLSLDDLRGQGYDGASTMSGANLVSKQESGKNNQRQYTLTVQAIPLI